MSQPESEFSQAMSTLAAAYRGLVANPAVHALRTVVISTLAAPLSIVASKVSTQPGVLDHMDDDAIPVYYELRVAQLVLAPLESRQRMFDSLDHELRQILRSKAARAQEAAGHLIGYLLVALEELPQPALERFLGLLASLTHRLQRTVDQLESPSETVEPARARLSELLDLGLFSEALCFTAGMLDLKSAPLPDAEKLPHSVVSIASRKGGVGKSTLALATALCQLRRPEPPNVCVIDLDITGPVWQYFIGPAKRNRLPHLNDLISFDQPEEQFEFPPLARDDVERCVGSVALPVPDRVTGIIEAREVGLISFADLPRTNRYLLQKVAEKRRSFTQFFFSLLQNLAHSYQFVIVDHSPGLDTHVLLSLAIATATRSGAALVVSTPHAADLIGTSLELSDLRLLGWKTAPAWIVNKVDSKAYEFFQHPHTLAELAKRFRGYRDIMPRVPLLQMVLTQRPLTIRPLLFNKMLAAKGIVDFMHPIRAGAIRRFVNTAWFRAFENDLLPRLPSQTRPSPDR